MKNVLIQLIYIIFQVINLVFLIRIILSWLPIGMNSFTNGIYSLTEPFLIPVRKLLSKSPITEGLMQDFSLIIFLVMLSPIEQILISLISSIF